MVDKHFLVHQNKHKLNESINNPVEQKNSNIEKEELVDTHKKLKIEENRDFEQIGSIWFIRNKVCGIEKSIRYKQKCWMSAVV